jgi:hypothetical protein
VNPKAGPTVLRITAIEGDDLPPEPDQLYGKDYHIVTYGCTVSDTGEVSYFQYTARDRKGSGYPVIPAEQFKQLKSILNNVKMLHI